MKKFRFRLEGLLRVRKLAEDKEVHALRLQRQELVGVDNQIARNSDERTATVKELVSLKTGQFSTRDVVAWQQYLNSLRVWASELQTTRQKLEPEVYVAQMRLQKASRQREMVERLKEKRYREHRLEVEKESSAELDAFGRDRYLAALREDL